MASVAEATRTLRTLRMAVRAEKMICKALNFFHIRNPATIRRYIQLCNWGLMKGCHLSGVRLQQVAITKACPNQTLDVEQDPKS